MGNDAEPRALKSAVVSAEPINIDLIGKAPSKALGKIECVDIGP